jgi:catechol 2,3-dioxygenase-like lactoylglutathione lyase family enzyme/heme-degrading monooxygenase HmoA
MLHHVDVHVSDLESSRRLFDALLPIVRYRFRHEEDGFAGYEPLEGGRPRIGFIHDPDAGGSMRLAFSVNSRERVDEGARLAAANGARVIEGPSVHPEYGDDYYAVFFEDACGNRFEILEDAAAAHRPRVARIWRARVRQGHVRAYRRYIEDTGMRDYRNTPGNCGAWILSAQGVDHDEILTLSFWESRDAIAQFAGEAIERAQYYPEDKRYLLEFPENVEHYDID